MADQGKLIAEAERRRQALVKQYVRDPYAARQRALWNKIIGLKILDIMEFEEAVSGADVCLHIMVPPREADMIANHKYMVMALIVDQNTTKLWFEEVTYSNGHLFDPDGKNVVHGLQNGQYTIL